MLNSTTNNSSTDKKDFEFYGYTSTNAWKILIILDELGLSFNYHHVDIINDEQFTEEFLKINPNNKIPVIIDNTVEPPITVIESGAILIYLAEKYGKLLPDNKTHPRERTEVLQWLAWQISTLGPYLGQLSYFGYYCETKIPIAIERYSKEARRMFKVLDGRLSTRPYVGW
ncbi:hypothetical protein DICPUDRAFT_149192 [Dictyostelium purpureum]|uniref:GST N-terminal domain-containing protein n=1 Tax=Dictyostelium purpureum TaxID=5786 RepID=F0ZD24_DICPU|nr:uncharacterized protein DICPUDRAFT_149192 [Dictyostelium purpureum]EGC38168.1 hypothetical protein DICPUDRAFT_149192 [Dictyostelium purpureum]|eukprot:XP_003285295.1 hypothetical protein DICPUDRAFT_149192 [Dictyostelium purpureum]